MKADDIQGTLAMPQSTTAAPQKTSVAPQTAASGMGVSQSSGKPPSPDDAMSGKVRSGAQADIIRTRHKGMDCVMKLFKPGYGSNKEVNDALGKLKGKGFITDVLDTGMKDGREYEIMPYYPLGSVADYDLRGKGMEIMTIAVKTAMALDAMHGKHVMHKDIKPANILVVDGDSLDTVICDFGIADIISGGKVVTRQVRTPVYAAPELYDPGNVVARLDGQDLFEITPAADFYSLGMTILSLWFGEKAFLKKEQEMAVLKLKGGVNVPDGMPEELAKMTEGLLEKNPKKRWGFKEIKELIAPPEIGEYGVRLFLNRLCDIRLNPNPDDPDYIVTGEQMGCFLNEVYLWHYAGSEAPADEKLCNLILDSFEKYEDSYVDIFFTSKGDYLKDFSDCMRRCVHNNYDTGKIATKDPDQRFQISMMKTIKSFGFNPSYWFKDTGELVSSLEDLESVKADKEAALKNGGLCGWIAVQLQEDPNADFSKPLSYEKALMKYVETVSEIYPHSSEVLRIERAFSEQQETERNVRKQIRGKWAQRVLQCILPFIPMVSSSFFVKLFIDLARVDPSAGTGIFNHMWIFAILGLAVGVLAFAISDSFLVGVLGFGATSFILLLIAKLTTEYMMWVMAAFSVAVAIFALVIIIIALWPDSNAISPKEVNSNTDDTLVEALDFAFSDEETFDSSLNGFISGKSMFWWKERLDKNRTRLLICFCCFALVVAAPYSFQRHKLSILFLMKQQKKCNKCGISNRPEARFCKHCGQTLPVEDKFKGFFGKKSLEPLLESYAGRAAVASKLHRIGGKTRIGMDALVLGDAGTGKRFVADKLFEILQRENVTTESQPAVVDAAEIGKWVQTFDANIEKTAGGVLIITNVQKLVPGEFATSVGQLDKLFSRMKSAPASLPVVIMCGLKRGMEGFLGNNPDIASLFEFRFDLSSFSEEDLCSLCCSKLKEDFHIEISEEASAKLLKHLIWMTREGGGTCGNGHIADALAQDLAVNAVSCGRKMVEPEDVKGRVFEPRTEAQIWQDLDGFVGLENVKKEIHAIIDYIRETRLTGSEMRIEDHYVFTGNPGTGKTTVARIFADILGAIGILPKGQFVEVAGKDLIADIVGGSERKVQEAVDKAMGGVLFIDEAYSLAQGEFGQAAIDKLLPIVENHRGEFVCILAGYTCEMRDFMKANSGLESRFNKTIDFPDYNAAELEQIFRIMASKKGYSLDAESDSKLHMEMEKMYNRRRENFGNARDIRNYLSQAEQRRRERLREAGVAVPSDKTLTYTDIAGKDANAEINVKDVMKELDALVGLDGVKSNLRRLAASVNREQRIAEAEGRTPDIKVGHYLFLGNPGTGKTTVARLMGRMLYAMKLIPRPDVTEVLRDDLVSNILGGTAQQTKETVMDAMGGVLFIDEAYSLCSGMQDSYGQECINTLVPLLENYQGKFVCIAAGYSREMQDFLDANSGLKSRFRNRIEFEDYSPGQMMEIFEGMVRKQDLILPEESRKAVRHKLQDLYDNRTFDFANAREVRNLVDDIKNNMAMRQFNEDCSDLQELKTIRTEDVI